MSHFDLLRRLLPASVDPQAPVLGVELQAEAAALDAAQALAAVLLDEADPRLALVLLTDWERVLGLPDTCSAGLATTLQERRAAIVAKLSAVGGCSLAYFEALALAMGYPLAIDIFRPFRAGLNRCGDRLMGGNEIRYAWRVRVTGARFTPFRAGGSQCGDLLGKIARAEDLECKLKRLKPAHTHLILSYEGA